MGPLVLVVPLVRRLGPLEIIISYSIHTYIVVVVIVVQYFIYDLWRSNTTSFTYNCNALYCSDIVRKYLLQVNCIEKVTNQRRNLMCFFTHSNVSNNFCTTLNTNYTFSFMILSMHTVDSFSSL